jgi:hypothetical protein
MVKRRFYLRVLPPGSHQVSTRACPVLVLGSQRRVFRRNAEVVGGWKLGALLEVTWDLFRFLSPLRPAVKQKPGFFKKPGFYFDADQGAIHCAPTDLRAYDLPIARSSPISRSISSNVL